VRAQDVGIDAEVEQVRTGEFVAFVGARGGLAECDAGTLAAFVATLARYQVKTVEQKLCAVRTFLRFASADGLVDAAVLDAVPAVRSSKQGSPTPSTTCGLRACQKFCVTVLRGPVDCSMWTNERTWLGLRSTVGLT
jgi:hypothetical protein